MAKIKVHIINFHSITSHVEIVLENKSTDPHTYYHMDRWSEPKSAWDEKTKNRIAEASSTYSFDLKNDAEPEEIVCKWNTYWQNKKGSATGNNCAAAVQWFLQNFAGIPKPNLSNTSVNHLWFGLPWPSEIPLPVLLPGRVMSNAQFYITGVQPRIYPSCGLDELKVVSEKVFGVAALLNSYGFLKTNDQKVAKELSPAEEKPKENELKTYHLLTSPSPIPLF